MNKADINNKLHYLLLNKHCCISQGAYDRGVMINHVSQIIYPKYKVTEITCLHPTSLLFLHDSLK